MAPKSPHPTQQENDMRRSINPIDFSIETSFQGAGGWYGKTQDGKLALVSTEHWTWGMRRTFLTPELATEYAVYMQPCPTDTVWTADGCVVTGLHRYSDTGDLGELLGPFTNV